MNLTDILLSAAFTLLAVVILVTYATAPAWQTIALIVAAMWVGVVLGRG